MLFQDTKLPGVYLLEPERHEDERGFFARLWSREEFRARGLNGDLSQISVSYNHRRGTLRGMHWQVPPHAEAKIVFCTAGAIYDVALDVRPGSPTARQWVGYELTASNRRALYLPEGYAHGFQTLSDDAEVLYLISAAYEPTAARGARWDDPAFAIEWPTASDRVINDRDRNWPLWSVRHV
jgi:dTDP-4-dehydrorhamnose 3,5-epimerase